VKLEHAGAGARGSDDIVETIEGGDDLFGNAAGIAAVAGIVCRLAATGLDFWNTDRTAGGLEKPDRRESNVWPKEIDEAGYEQPDRRSAVNLFGHSSVPAFLDGQSRTLAGR
jgi:hypothetical protein